jgi:molybdopterin molybdotransferase
LEKLGRGGSARLRPLVLADGLGRISGECDDLPKGSALRFYPFGTAFNL